MPPADGTDRGWQEWIDVHEALAFLHCWRSDTAGIDEVHARLGPVVDERGTPEQRAEYYGSRVRRGLRHLRYRADASVVADAQAAMRCLAGSVDRPTEGWPLFMLGFAQASSAALAAARDQGYL